MTNINLESVGKNIDGTWIFRDVTADFESGKIYGLIGKNGTGKTMLLRCLCGLSQISEGQITINGKVLGEEMNIPESVGVIIETPGFLPNLSGFSNLKYLAKLKNKINDTQIKQAMSIVGLQPDDRKRVSKYSLGMRQRLGIAQAIMENPDILLLDEPMNGLDSSGVADIKQLMKDLCCSNKIIIMASHHKEDICELCDLIYVLESGCLRQEKPTLLHDTVIL